MQLDSIYMARQASYTFALLDRCLFCPTRSANLSQLGMGKCRRTKSGKLLPGPSFTVPLVGGVVEMVLNPFKFWEDQRKTSFPGAPPVRSMHVVQCAYQVLPKHDDALVMLLVAAGYINCDSASCLQTY